MLTNTNAQSLFLETVKAGDVKQVAAYLNHPLIDPAARDNWAICLAAKNGHLEVVRLLLQLAIKLILMREPCACR